jgi:hypothetical protein
MNFVEFINQIFWNLLYVRLRIKNVLFQDMNALTQKGALENMSIFSDVQKSRHPNPWILATISQIPRNKKNSPYSTLPSVTFLLTRTRIVFNTIFWKEMLDKIGHSGLDCCHKHLHVITQARLFYSMYMQSLVMK